MSRSIVVAFVVLACAACGDSSDDAGGGAGAPSTLPVPSGAKAGDELVLRVHATTVAGSWDDASSPGAVLTVKAGANVARDVILVGGFDQETRASLGAWDGGAVTWTIAGNATFDAMDLTVDASAADIPVIALMSDEFDNDTPLVAFKTGDELEYVMTNEDGGTGLLPTLLLAQWGRPHDIEGLYDTVTREVQGPNHENFTFDGPFEGAHPRLRIATSNGLADADTPDSTARYHVSPMPVTFTSGDGVPRERVLDDYPWLVAAGWLEVAREGKVDEGGGVTDGMLGALSAYVFVDYDLEGGALASFEVMVGGDWYSSLGIYPEPTDLLDARSTGTGRTAIELPSGKTLADVTDLRIVPQEGTGTLAAARLLAYDPVSYEVVMRGEIAAPVDVDIASGPVELSLD